jgi:hypothetical protein
MPPVIAQDNVRVLQDLRDTKLRLVAPLFVTIEEQDGVVVASNVDLDVFGYGDTEAEALQDLRDIIVETYFDLKANRDQLAPHLQAIWLYLDRVALEMELQPLAA